MNPLEKLIKANDDYHEAADVVFCFGFEGLTEDEIGKIKARFGSIHEHVYRGIESAQDLLKDYFENVYEGDND